MVLPVTTALVTPMGIIINLFGEFGKGIVQVV